MAAAKYFKWAAHDDICAPGFISRCLEIMETNESIVLCHSNVHVINEAGEIIKDHPHRSQRINNFLKNIDADEPHLRFADLIQYAHPCIDIFGLIRTEILKKTSGIRAFIGSDRNLLAELALLGCFYRIPEFLFFSRSHQDRSIIIKDRLPVVRWFDANNNSRFVFPHWRNFTEYTKSVFRVELTGRQRLNCCRHLIKWLFAYRKRLYLDIKFAIKDISPMWFLDLYRRLKSLRSI